MDYHPVSLLKFVFGLKQRVTPARYAAAGFGLMIFKYLVEATVVTMTTGIFYNWWHFLFPSVSLRAPFFDIAPWLGWAIAIWSLPFIWIAVSMSIRRCVDAGLSQWCSLLVLVPILNLTFMLVMVFMPSHKSANVDQLEEESDQATRIPVAELKSSGAQPVKGLEPIDIDYSVVELDPALRKSNDGIGWVFVSTILGVLAGGLFTVLLTAISVFAIESYGSALFFGMPMVSGAVGGYIYNQPGVRDVGGSILVGFLTTLIGGLFILLFAMEGAICLLMAVPLICPVGAMGGFLGWVIAKAILVQSKYMIGSFVVLLPIIGMIEQRTTKIPTYVVESHVEIAAAPEEVWDNVVSFPDIQTAPAWYFKMGVAYPLRARIEGSGVGAVRHCEFTTGSFVEPITTWNPPNHLAFDVTEQPDPLTELSPYRHIHPPHLDGSFKSVRGEFRLVRLDDNKTRLEGRTWYRMNMGPRRYWKTWADGIVHDIHLRVLDHIKEQCETE